MHIRSSREAVPLNRGSEVTSYDAISLMLTTKHTCNSLISGEWLYMVGALQVLVHERPSREVVLHNRGSEAFDFAWDAVSPPLSIEPASGSVAAGACQTCRITFCLATAGALAGHRITCRVLHGRTYIISLTGGNRRTTGLSLAHLCSAGACFRGTFTEQNGSAVIHR